MIKNIIIIGNGAAGISAAEEIRSHDKDVKITIITDEPTVAYYRPMLSEYISEEEVPKRFFLHTEEWYEEQGLELQMNTHVIGIDSNNQTIDLSTGATLNYDRLILTTGSYNFIPPMEGIEKSNVASLRTLGDANDIKQMVKTSKKVVILGGGLLGLELGWQLIKLNCEVTVVEMMERLLPRQLDEKASMIFEEKVFESGIKVIKGVKTTALIGEENISSVELSDGTKLPCDLVLYSIGVRAQTELAEKANLNINRGILVNEFMQTSNPNIYAAGDCAEYEGINYAIWPEAIAQGKIAGKNAIGTREAYATVIPFNIYSGINMRLFSIGDVGSNPDKHYETINLGDAENYEIYYFENDIFIGGILIGDIKKSVKLKNALANKLSMADFKATVL